MSKSCGLQACVRSILTCIGAPTIYMHQFPYGVPTSSEKEIRAGNKLRVRTGD